MCHSLSQIVCNNRLVENAYHQMCLACVLCAGSLTRLYASLLACLMRFGKRSQQEASLVRVFLLIRKANLGYEDNVFECAELMSRFSEFDWVLEEDSVDGMKEVWSR